MGQSALYPVTPAGLQLLLTAVFMCQLLGVEGNAETEARAS